MRLKEGLLTLHFVFGRGEDVCSPLTSLPPSLISQKDGKSFLTLHIVSIGEWQVACFSLATEKGGEKASLDSPVLQNAFTTYLDECICRPSTIYLLKLQFKWIANDLMI